MGFKYGGKGVEPRLTVERPGHQVLLPTSVPERVTVRAWVGRRGHCVFSEQRSSQSCWQEIAGTVGRGRLVAVPTRPISHQLVGVWQLGGPGRDDLGEVGREQNLSPQSSLWSPLDSGGLLRSPWHDRASVQVQMLRPERKHDLPKVTQ